MYTYVSLYIHACTYFSSYYIYIRMYILTNEINVFTLDIQGQSMYLDQDSRCLPYLPHYYHWTAEEMRLRLKTAHRAQLTSALVSTMLELCA